MNLNLLNIFIKVAETGSLSLAAKQLSLPKSKVSRDLVKLEDSLEMTLLTRSPQGVSLTPQGQELLRNIGDPLSQLNTSIRMLKSRSGIIKGQIKLTAPEDFSIEVLPPLLQEFMEVHPEVSIELYSTNSILDFQKYQIDLALRVGKLEDSTLIQKKIGDVAIGLYASKKYLSRFPKIKGQKDLDIHNIGLFKDLYGNKFNKKFLSGTEFKFSSNSLPVLKNFVLNDYGIATLPHFILKKEIHADEVEAVLKNEIYVNSSVYLLSKGTKYTPEHVRLFKSYLYDKIRSEF